MSIPCQYHDDSRPNSCVARLPTMMGGTASILRQYHAGAVLTTGTQLIIFKKKETCIHIVQNNLYFQKITNFVKHFCINNILYEKPENLLKNSNKVKKGVLRSTISNWNSTPQVSFDK